MNDLARLADRLTDERGGDARRALLRDYLARVEDPDRGFGLGLLVGAVRPPRVTRAVWSGLVAARVDSLLLDLALAHGGDAVETFSLVWPARPGANRAPGPADLAAIAAAPGADPLPALIRLLDALDPDGRRLVLRLTLQPGRPLIPVTLAQEAVAALGPHGTAEIAALWAGAAAPYEALLAHAEGTGPRPAPGPAPFIAPAPETPADTAPPDLAAWRVTWARRGPRVQWVIDPGEARLYTDEGRDVTARFPELSDPALLARLRDGGPGALRIDARLETEGDPAALAARLTAATNARALMRRAPARLVALDIRDGAGDGAGIGADTIRDLVARVGDPRLSGEPALPIATLEDLARAWAEAPADAQGVTLWRRDASGARLRLSTPRRALAAAILYVARGSGPLHDEATLALRRGDGLVPVGKAKLEPGTMDAARLDAHARAKAVDRHGPVRVLGGDLIARITYAGVERSRRHKAGLVLRDARIEAILWEGGAAIDTLASLEAALGPETSAGMDPS